MKNVFYCANCGKEIETEAYMFRDNYLQVKYFDDNKSNRFCSQDCACESLFGDYVYLEDLPLDDDEEAEETEQHNCHTCGQYPCLRCHLVEYLDEDCDFWIEKEQED